MVSLAALAGGCQTFSALPEEARLTALMASPPDYNVYAKRKEQDAVAARSLGGNVRSLAVAQLENDEGFTILRESDALQQRLQDFYSPLLPKDLTPTPSSTFYVAEENGLNAHALSTGDIVIESGVLTSINTFDEINFVLAHEGAHVLLDHFRSDEVKRAADTATSLAYLVAAYTDNQKNAAAYRAGRGPSAQLSYATLAVVGFSAFTNFLAERREKQQEIEADQLGLEMLVTAPANNSQNGASNLLNRLVTNAAEAVENEKAQIERAEAELELVCGPKKTFGAEQLLGEILAGAVPVTRSTDTRPQVCQLRDRGLIQLDGRLKDKEKERARLQERLDLMRKYQALRYGDVMTFPPLTEIKTANGRNSFAALYDPNGPVIRLEEVREVRARLNVGDCKGAQILARQFTKARGGDADTFGPLRDAYFDADADPKCNAADAGRHARIANTAGEASPEFLKKAYAYYYARNEYAGALEMLEAFASRSGKFEDITPDKIKLLVLLGRKDEAAVLKASCESNEEFSRTIKTRCTEYLAAGLAEIEASEAAKVDEISMLIDTLSYDVMRAAFSRDEIRAILPVGVDYTLYIPTDRALREATAGDPYELLKPEHARLLADIVRSHVVLKPGALPIAGTLSVTTGKASAAAAHAAFGEADVFLQHVAEQNGVVFGLPIYGSDGAAFLTDTVRLGVD